MRLFVAIEIPSEIRDYLYEICKKVKTNNSKINFVHKKNLHITLKFIGEVNGEQIEGIILRLEKIKGNKINTKLSNLGFFPDSKVIRVIFAGVEPKDEIIKLQREIDSNLLDLFSKEQKFECHLTLGRVKLIKDKKKFLDLVGEISIKPMTFEINEFKLVKSTLTRTGPIYEEIKLFKL